MGSASAVFDGLALVVIPSDEDRYGTQAFINASGDIVIGPGPPPGTKWYDEWQDHFLLDAEPYGRYEDFHEGLAVFWAEDARASGGYSTNKERSYENALSHYANIHSKSVPKTLIFGSQSRIVGRPRMRVEIEYRDETRGITRESVLPLYKANEWSSANKPKELYRSLMNSHSLVTAWDGEKLVGLANAISDGYLVVYYSHVLVLPDYQGQGVGRELMNRVMSRYPDFHQHMLVADNDSIGFYEKCGFVRAGKTESMWIYQGTEH